MSETPTAVACGSRCQARFISPHHTGHMWIRPRGQPASRDQATLTLLLLEAFLPVGLAWRGRVQPFIVGRPLSAARPFHCRTRRRPAWTGPTARTFANAFLPLFPAAFCCGRSTSSAFLSCFLRISAAARREGACEHGIRHRRQHGMDLPTSSSSSRVAALEGDAATDHGGLIPAAAAAAAAVLPYLCLSGRRSPVRS